MAFKKQPQKHSFEKMTFELVSLTTDKFNTDDLINVLEKITFNLININLNTDKQNLGSQGKGTSSIGFVNKFYQSEDGKFVFDVVVASKYVDAVQYMTNCSFVGVHPKVFMNKENKITKVISLDLIECK